jgi:hypothetical protein
MKLSTLPVAVLVLALHASPAGGKLAFLSSYDYDPAAQHGWLTLGKTDNLTLLLQGWGEHRIPALFELGKSGPEDLWCFSGTQNTSNPLIPCGGRGSATFAARLSVLIFNILSSSFPLTFCVFCVFTCQDDGNR